VSEKGVSIVDTNVVVLGEGKSFGIWQVLGEDEVILGFLQLSPWDPCSHLLQSLKNYLDDIAQCKKFQFIHGIAQSYTCQ
jgi:hypothetical protein